MKQWRKLQVRNWSSAIGQTQLISGVHHVVVEASFPDERLLIRTGRDFRQDWRYGRWFPGDQVVVWRYVGHGVMRRGVAQEAPTMMVTPTASVNSSVVSSISGSITSSASLSTARDSDSYGRTTQDSTVAAPPPWAPSVLFKPLIGPFD